MKKQSVEELQKELIALKIKTRDMLESHNEKVLELTKMKQSLEESKSKDPSLIKKFETLKQQFAEDNSFERIQANYDTLVELHKQITGETIKTESPAMQDFLYDLRMQNMRIQKR